MTTHEYLDHFRRRVLQEALLEALPSYWERRARTFDAVAPRPNDRMSPRTAEIAAAAAETAQACRNAAVMAADQIEEWLQEPWLAEAVREALHGELKVAR